MNFTEYLSKEWVRALGCTEPAAIALACATASMQAKGEVKSVRLVVDPKIYKNCYAVGIPHSMHRTGIRWAAAIGSLLPDASAGLECFKKITPDILKAAEKILSADGVEVEVDTSKSELFIDCAVKKTEGSGRAVIAGDHTNIIRIEKDSKAILDKPAVSSGGKAVLRGEVAKLSITEMCGLARSVNAGDEKRFNEGILLNRKISEHGLKLFPKSFVELAGSETLTRISKLVCAGVYARMWGEDFPVMSLAGSGNKGIVASVPLAVRGDQKKLPHRCVHEALALACLVTSATTYYLGSLSAVCGCSNAAGIGLAAGLVLMEGGGEKEIALAINNMVGNVTGMICDGAKIGCALKTMTAVDAAFRCATLAMNGIGIPVTDGIVGGSAKASLENLGRIAARGMTSTDDEILAIMREKLEG